MESDQSVSHVDADLAKIIHGFRAALQKLMEINKLLSTPGEVGATELRTRIASAASKYFDHDSDVMRAGMLGVLEAATNAVFSEQSMVSTLSRHAVRIDHVAIAVTDLDQAIESLTGYGFSVIERRKVTGEVSGMESATVRAGGVTFVLCQGDSPQSNVSKFIDAFGPGVQHLAIEVIGLERVITDLKMRQADLLTGVIGAPGLRQVFTRRSSVTGMQFEFVERNNAVGFDDGNIRELFTAMEREGVF